MHTLWTYTIGHPNEQKDPSRLFLTRARAMRECVIAFNHIYVDNGPYPMTPIFWRSLGASGSKEFRLEPRKEENWVVGHVFPMLIEDTLFKSLEDK